MTSSVNSWTLVYGFRSHGLRSSVAAQRRWAWLRTHHGVDNLVQSMRDWSAGRGAAAGVPFAEGFRQHLGHSYPQSNLLAELLGAK